MKWLLMSDADVLADVRRRRGGATRYHRRLERMIMRMVGQARLLAPVAPNQVRRLDGACMYLLAYLSHDEIVPMREVRRGLREVLADDGYAEAMCAMHDGLTSPLLGLHYPTAV